MTSQCERDEVKRVALLNNSGPFNKNLYAVWSFSRVRKFIRHVVLKVSVVSCLVFVSPINCLTDSQSGAALLGMNK